jgi:hypothetical protein
MTVTNEWKRAYAVGSINYDSTPQLEIRCKVYKSARYYFEEDLLLASVFVPQALLLRVGCILISPRSTLPTQPTHCKQRIYQLDDVAAFLQAAILGRKVTIFPKG